MDSPRKPCVDIINQTLLISYVKHFLQSLSNVKYDVLIAITHLDLQTDIQLAETIPEINLILGGHEHENYFLTRGEKSLPIHKADANVITVFIHRFAFNLNTKCFRICSTLAKVTDQVEDMGYEPNRIVCCLPSGVELDGRSSSVRNSVTLLPEYCCECLISSTSLSNTTIGVFDNEQIRIDDILRDTITQYEI